eukprot:2423326-Pleurochrysis_carterae.AAC.1
MNRSAQTCGGACSWAAANTRTHTKASNSYVADYSPYVPYHSSGSVYFCSTARAACSVLTCLLAFCAGTSLGSAFGIVRARARARPPSDSGAFPPLTYWRACCYFLAPLATCLHT